MPKDQQSLIKFLSGVVLLTGGLVALSLLALNPKENGPSLSTLARAPANLVGMALAVSKSNDLHSSFPEHTFVIEFGCQPPEETTLPHHIKQLRIAGKICSSSSQDLIETQLVNLSNGFSATIFQPDRSSFTSDYIHLAEGDNQLQLSYKSKNGAQKRFALKIVRSLH